MVFFQTVAEMGHGEGAWNGGGEARLGGDESLADAVCERGWIRGDGLHGGGVECVDHADDGSKQAEQRRGGHEGRHETELVRDKFRGTESASVQPAGTLPQPPWPTSS